MDITIDTSVILAVVCGEASRDRAVEVTAGQKLVAPGSLHWEVGNALSAMIKRKRITAPQANVCIEAYLQIPIRLLAVELKQSIGFVRRQRVYAYDAYMLVCALQTGTPLLTADEALKVHAEALGIEVLEI